MADNSLVPRIAAIYELQAALLSPELQRIGISFGTFQLLAAISGSKNGASQAEIARRLGISPATLSESVRSHVTRELIEQVESLTDRRVKLLKLTPTAAKNLKSVKDVLEEIERKILKDVKKGELKTCCETLDNAIIRMQRLLEK